MNRRWIAWVLRETQDAESILLPKRGDARKGESHVRNAAVPQAQRRASLRNA